MNLSELRRCIARLAFLLSSVLILAPVALAQDPTAAVRQLDLQQRDKVVRLRHLVSDSRVHYDKAGALSGKWKAGRWTWNGSVQVRGVELKDGVLKIKANRLLLNYKRSIHKFAAQLIGETVEIDIEISSDAGQNPDLLKEWNKAFLKPMEIFPEQMQPYWKPFLECLQNPKTDSCEHYEKESWKPDIYDVKGKSTDWQPSYPGVEDVGHGVSVPKIKSKVEPVYTDIARHAGVEGTVLLEAIVNQEGRLEVKRVVRPIGWGLEENAAEAMAKWTFDPSRKNGVPVSVRLIIEINFGLRK